MGVRNVEDFPYEKIDRLRRDYLAKKIHEELGLVKKRSLENADTQNEEELPVKESEGNLEGTMCTAADIEWLKESSDPTVVYVVKHLTQHLETTVFPPKFSHFWPWHDEESWRFYARTVDLLNSEAILLSTERVVFTRANWMAWIVLVIIVSSLFYLGIWFLIPASIACVIYGVIIAFFGEEPATNHWLPLESKNDWVQINQTIRAGSHSHKIPEPIEEAIREHESVSGLGILYLIYRLPFVVIFPIFVLAVSAIPFSEEENMALIPSSPSRAAEE